MTKQLALPTGPVRQVFTVEGKSVKELSQIEDGANYIAASAEKFNKELCMSIRLFN